MGTARTLEYSTRRLPPRYFTRGRIGWAFVLVLLLIGFRSGRDVAESANFALLQWRVADRSPADSHVVFEEQPARAAELIAGGGAGYERLECLNRADGAMAVWHDP